MGKCQFSFILVTRPLSRKQIANLSVSDGSVNALTSYKIKSIFLLTLDFAADPSRCG